MVRIAAALASVTLLFLAPSANAEFYTGSKLFSMLEKDVRGGVDYESGLASGYVVGVIDTALGTYICFPAGDNNITIRQVKQIVYNYMQKHPELWSSSADVSIVAAMREIFPCKK